MKLYLASTSPRRKNLLARLGIPFEVVPPTFLEHETTLTPSEETLLFAEEKARSIASPPPNALILGCDTLIACDGQKLGKPEDAADAKRILKILSGKTHEVHTALFLLDTQNGSSKRHLETTRVTFRRLSDPEIATYVATGEPFGKAGAYAIQGRARGFITKIEGDEESVIGLPLKILRGWLGS
ncbi:MAG: septum formation protein Maf [Deltaproteobacteria bacterium]|nr:septum formation protein Maf [Deltaproteobacteria bacterium]